MAAKDPSEVLSEIASKNGLSVDSAEFAQLMDDNDELREFRQKFHLPDGMLYFTGNSLGMPPKKAKEYINEVFDNWATLGVQTHFTGLFAAAHCDKPGLTFTEEIVGGKPNEVALLNGLTVNLQLLLSAFYQPRKDRWKILIEAHAFPSDRYVVFSQAELHGYDKDAIIILEPREGEEILRTEDILETIRKEGHQIAVALLPGIQYYTGQLFDIPAITEELHTHGIIAGWDLAHAVGNVNLQLHDWNVDFAAWCSYKYLNSSPGGVGGLFLHEKYFESDLKTLTGWWSNKSSTRFEMRFDLDKEKGAAGFCLSNPPPLLMAPNYASLEIFHEAGMARILRKQFLLTGFLEYLIQKNFPTSVKIITPKDVTARGSQLSLEFDRDLQKIHRELEANNCICDTRGNVMRAAPAPLYNSYMDVWKFVQVLQEVLN